MSYFLTSNNFDLHASSTFVLPDKTPKTQRVNQFLRSRCRMTIGRQAARRSERRRVFSVSCSPRRRRTQSRDQNHQPRRRWLHRKVCRKSTSWQPTLLLLSVKTLQHLTSQTTPAQRRRRQPSLFRTCRSWSRRSRMTSPRDTNARRVPARQPSFKSTSIISLKTGTSRRARMMSPAEKTGRAQHRQVVTAPVRFLIQPGTTARPSPQTVEANCRPSFDEHQVREPPRQAQTHTHTRTDSPYFWIKLLF